MKTLPTAITTGLSSNLAQFWLVKVEGSASTYYWTTQSKNLTAQSLILKDSTVTVTVDSTVIARIIDGEEQSGIGQIEYGVDISQGGGIASAADVEIDILNQDRKDTTILATPNRLEYRPVTIYMGFIPAGASPTVEITTDMLQMWTGVVDEVLDFDYGHFRLSCIDGVFLRHKTLPRTLVDIETYPYAPKESLGKPIPILYGDFQESDEDQARELMVISPIPTIKTDDLDNKFYVAGHAIHTLGNSYFFAQKNICFAKILTAPTTSNTSSGATVDWSSQYINTIVTEFVIQPKNWFNSASTTEKNAVDDSLTTYASGDSSLPTQTLQYRFIAPDDEGILSDSTGAEGVTPALQYLTRWGTISGAGTNNMVWVNASLVETNVGTVAAADSDTTKTFSFTISGLTWENLAQYTWGLNAAIAVPSSFQLKNFAIKFYVRPVNFLFKKRPLGLK